MISWSTSRPLMKGWTPRYCCCTIQYQLVCRQKGNDSRESIAISCTVVIRPKSDTLGFRRRRSDCSLSFTLKAVPAKGRSGTLLDCDMASAKACSGSGLFRPAEIHNLSFAGNNWYLRVSEGWCILQINLSFPFSSPGAISGI